MISYRSIPHHIHSHISKSAKGFEGEGDLAISDTEPTIESRKESAWVRFKSSNVFPKVNAFTYRNIQIYVSRLANGHREWTIYPNDSPPQTGYCQNVGGSGSFPAAMAAAEAAIDNLLRQKRRA